ncbi:DUF2235 domain-containing protein [Tardiphaga alba]|nr:DUF2235 domain-containing protein [Tardiphaga alba]
MVKNIVLLSDGTGNSSGKLFKTNVWRLYQLLDLRKPADQIAYYDDGVGTSSFKLFAILGGIFGFGLKRNVIDIYSFCCRNYQPGDRIYGFGFSRGAFTMRIVAGMIARQGLIAYQNDEAALGRYAADAYRDYRRRFNITKGLVTPARAVRDAAIWTWRKMTGAPVTPPPPIHVDSIHFIGLWDTVDAYGGPIEEMTRAIDYWVWPLSMPDRFMNAKVHRACHALAIEDERDAFRPVIWDQRYVRGHDDVPGRKKKEWLFDANYQAPSVTGRPLETPPHLRMDLPEIDRERISQVWFTGVHADIGGGYPQDGLSYVTFDWMLDRASAYGLLLLQPQRQMLVDPQINPNDKLNDSREGVAAYYRYRPRNIAELYDALPYKPSIRRDVRHLYRLLTGQSDQKQDILSDLHPTMPQHVVDSPRAVIHQTVFDRIAKGNDRYAPAILPRIYDVTDKAGAIARGRSPVDPGQERSQIQDDVWNWIWLRRVVYFLTVFASLFIAIIPLLVIYVPEFGRQTVGAFVNPVVNMVASFLPALLNPWFDAFRSAPGFVLIGVILVGLLLLYGSYLQLKIRDVMRIGWHSPTDYPALTGWHKSVYKLRRQGWYRAFFYVLKNWIFPTGIAFWLFWWLAFGTANTLGLICKGNATLELSTTTPQIVSPHVMDTASICNATGIKVKEGETYDITLRITEPWLDDTIDGKPNGFGWAKSSWVQVPAIPYRRLIWSNWFATILRVGEGGLEEHLLDLTTSGNDIWTATFKPRRDGEVFVYVNDAVISLPWVYDFFYRHNNHGKAEVTLRKRP